MDLDEVAQVEPFQIDRFSLQIQLFSLLEI